MVAIKLLRCLNGYFDEFFLWQDVYHILKSWIFSCYILNKFISDLLNSVKQSEFVNSY